jgi:hypothetical protein
MQFAWRGKTEPSLDPWQDVVEEFVAQIKHNGKFTVATQALIFGTISHMLAKGLPESYQIMAHEQFDHAPLHPQECVKLPSIAISHLQPSLANQVAQPTLEDTIFW